MLIGENSWKNNCSWPRGMSCFLTEERSRILSNSSWLQLIAREKVRFSQKTGNLRFTCDADLFFSEFFDWENWIGTTWEVIFLLEKCVAILCVSEFIKKKFLQGINGDVKKVHVLYNGVERKLLRFPIKNKEVLFVGRLVPEKGVHFYVEALKLISDYHPEWRFGLIGSFRLGDNENTNSYASKVIKSFKSIGSQAHFYGFQDNTFVQEKMKSASIIVIPSLWQEPFGLVVAEAMSNGTCIIASRVGGIPEIIESNGILINNINHKKLSEMIDHLIKNDKLRKNFQRKAWKNFRFYSDISSKRLDYFRKIIFLNSA